MESKTAHKIIAVDFDGCLVINKWPEVGAPIEKNINKLKAEQADGAKVILWTNRVGEALEKALEFCKEQGIHLDAVNENLPEIVEDFGGDCRKIFANEYWDDRAVLMSEQDIGEFSDGYHTFNSLYHQRLILFAALVNTFPTLAWKSHKHFDGEVPFGGGWFIVGIETPKGQYTYHYEEKDWDLFRCKEVPTAPQWDGHTDADVERLLAMTEGLEGDVSSWAAKEVELACQKEKEASEDSDEWDYGVACYESALRAYECLCRDGHSGFSIQITKSILNRLVDGKCLTPIEDTPDIWNEIDNGKGAKKYQCKRMSSLFKEVASDGTATYRDVNRVYCVNIDAPDVSYTNGLATRLVDKLFPITMPYLPTGKKFKVVREEFLVDEKNGDYDTLAFLWIETPDGKKVEVNRYFKESDSTEGFTPIDKAEYEDRKARKVK
ncbi:hypothetical protein CE91St42_23520 [Oscillospiraceae bacterium]|nr:hypothetical protein CE91St42_23520 [Oscillospiraceae bacterium]